MPDHDPDVTPEQEARLRSLLREARHGEPVPLDVAARLDRVLDQLAASEGTDPDATRSVVDLAARRRRRVTTLLAAAAAVVVVGVGLGQVLPTGQDDAITAGDSADAGASAESADAPQAAGSEEDGLRSYGTDLGDSSAAGSGEAPAEPGLPAPNEYDGSLTPSTQGRPAPPVRLTADGFARQVERLVERPGVEQRRGSVVPSDRLSRDERFVCDDADWGGGRLLAALYDGIPAVLAYRPVAGKTQTVDLLRCGTAEALRSTVLPVEN